MNLMFRKNFREGASKSAGGGGKLQSKANRTKRSRDMGLVQQPEEIHYRTHLFFSPNRPGYEVGEERCSALSGIPSTPILSTATSFALPGNLQPYELDAPQPLVDRRPSFSLMRWNSSSSGPVNFGGGGHSGVTRAEPISLATLDRDCFIIPVHSVDRFLPAGIPLPALSADGKTASPLSVLEVSDPKLCILVHLMSPLEAIDPVMESPLAHPLLKQRSIASELVSEVQQANTAVGGMLLANMEKSSEFPFISYYLINTLQTDPSNFYASLRVSSLSKFEPKALKYTAAHTLDLYSEVASIYRPPLVLPSNEAGSFKKSQTAATGYIITVFKAGGWGRRPRSNNSTDFMKNSILIPQVFEGDDGERFEKNWLYWTGARMLYRYLPRAAGLRRIALHKSTSQKGDKMYLLVCECADLLKDISLAAFLIPAMRARLCGYTGLYRPIQAF
ncbi:GL10817 [Drosophila persimilis]|uniref:GL10817 n=1 Tax=Drosophila persimilis TaxID=7234 RepID=B4GDP5_DROPE|nr:GL10817 [Drosophila persimilis]